LENAKILVLGAGGAARAAVFGLKERGAEVYILNRTPVQAQKLARQAKARTLKRPDLKKHAFDVIINATPVGMGNPQESPLTESEIKTKYAFDMVYNPPETKFLKLAKAAGAEVILGAEMFVQQAARQFEIWTGKPAPWDEMLRVVGKALAEETPKSEANGVKKKS
jgi:3-dehydroquinate dehydratase/shikimate dehydrogenase